MCVPLCTDVWLVCVFAESGEEWVNMRPAHIIKKRSPLATKLPKGHKFEREKVARYALLLLLLYTIVRLVGWSVGYSRTDRWPAVLLRNATERL